jgi:YfiH family protein
VSDSGGGSGPGLDRGPTSDRDPDAGLLYLDGLESLTGIAHAFETRQGSIRDTLPAPVARVQQVHGNTVLRLPHDRDQWPPFLEPDTADRPPADALITNAVGVTVAVAVADCLPILIADPEHGAVAAVHGGWRGLAADIVAEAFACMGKEFGSLPDECAVGIGPGIGPCCYEVGPEVIAAFATMVGVEEAALQRPGRPQSGEPGSPGGVSVTCNLPAVAAAQARRCGVPEERIFTLSLCTRCHSDRLWSYRQLGSAAGRMLAGIAVTR